MYYMVVGRQGAKVKATSVKVSMNGKYGLNNYGGFHSFCISTVFHTPSKKDLDAY